jgi:DNA segregation ATPase FtsK/SpoIIIE, S-DNA-T family
VQHAAGVGHGQGWATQGYSAATIAPGERGVGLLLAEDGTPVRMLGFYLPDDQLTAIAERASALRADEWLADAGGGSEAA